MLTSHCFVRRIEIPHAEMLSWKNSIDGWLRKNLAALSSIKTGHVLEIEEYKCSMAQVMFFESKLVVHVTIRAKVFLPQIGKVYRAELKESNKEFSIYTMPYSLIYLQGQHTEPTLNVTVDTFRYSNGQFFIGANCATSSLPQ